MEIKGHENLDFNASGINHTIFSRSIQDKNSPTVFKGLTFWIWSQDARRCAWLGELDSAEESDEFSNEDDDINDQVSRALLTNVAFK